MSLAMRIEEIPTVGGITMHAFHERKARFVDFSTMYDGTFEADCLAKIALLGGVVTTRFHIGKISDRTQLIEGEILFFYPMLDILELHVKHAKALLTVPVESFGIHEVREAIHSGDVEKMDGKLKTLVENIDANYVVLEGKGYKAADFTSLKDLKLKVFNDNVEQEGWKFDKEQAVEENMGLFMEVDAMIKDIQATGQGLFKHESAAITKEFTMSEVLKNIRNA